MAKNPKTPRRPADMSQLAKRIVDITTGEKTDEAEAPVVGLLEAKETEG